jgi:GT2 family glycosyltransferase
MIKAFLLLVRRFLGRVLPEPVKAILRKLIRPSFVLVTDEPAMSEPGIPRRRMRSDDFYDSLPIVPDLTNEVATSVLAHSVSELKPLRPDIICFSIIDWEFRFQRPQQIMSQFAAHGHRVFYISPTKFPPVESFPRVTVREIRQNIYEVILAVHHTFDVVEDVVQGEDLEFLLGSLDELRRMNRIGNAISYVMIPSWTKLAIKARDKWGWQVVYDCMDEWNNFPRVKPAVIDAEIELVETCDLLIVTSQCLYDKWQKMNRPIVLARNAADYQFYADRFYPNNKLDGIPHPIIGYYGAIADWFNLDLIVYVARSRPTYTFVLLGGVYHMDVSTLDALPNIRLLGQQPYETMPQYLHNFDVCIIPFKINEITEATDPVKIYEYFCGGKPVVSVALPELKSYQKLLYVAKDQDDFVEKLDLAVAEDNPDMRKRRMKFASQNTWENRYQNICSEIYRVTPRASIVIVTYNNLVYTRLCLESILKNTDYINYEVIIVDNNSTDGTCDYLGLMTDRFPNLHVIFNESNHGFARANNQGLAQASGEYFILLNNDTIVPSGWLSRLLRHLLDLQVGLVGPVTNFVTNEARVEISYQTWREMEAFAENHVWSNENIAADIHMLAMYCVAFRREVYQDVGPLDEQFGLGMFEDDDYAMRMREKGYRVLCAVDVFIHHFGQASFKKLIQDGSYDSLFEENQKRYEKKWAVSWQTHVTGALNTFVHVVNTKRDQ